jgi:small redox-active disulfide protein 2
MKKVEVIGTGCAKCRRLLANAEQAVRELKMAAEVLKVDDIDAIVDRGIMMTPALFIDGQVRAEGRVPDVNEIKNMLSA